MTGFTIRDSDLVCLSSARDYRLEWSDKRFVTIDKLQTSGKSIVTFNKNDFDLISK